MRRARCSCARAASRSGAPRRFSSPRASARGRCRPARNVLSRPARTTGPSRFPAGRCPACSPPAPRRRSSRHTGCTPGERLALRRQRPARARVPGAAPPLRRERRRGARGRAGAGAGGRRAGSRRRRAGTCRSCGTRCGTAASSLRGRVPLRYRRIVVRAEGRERVEAVVHAAVDDDWRVRAGTEERSRSTRSASATASSRRSSSSGSPAATSATTRISAGPVVVVDAWQRTTVRRVSRPATARACAARTSPRTRGGSRCSGRLDPRRGRRAAGAAQPPARLRARTSSARSPDVRGRARDLRADDARDGRSAAARRCAGRELERPSTPPRPQRRQGASRASRWASARAATASGRSRRCSRARHGVPLAELPLATPRSPARPVALAAIADESDRGSWALPVPTDGAAVCSAAEQTRGPLPAETDVVIVGGGLAGTALAYYLARRGHRGAAARARRS